MKNQIKKGLFFLFGSFAMKKESTDFTTTRPDYPANKAGCPLFYPPEYGIQSDISRVI